MISINCTNLKKVLTSIKSAIGSETEKVSLVFGKGELTVLAMSSKLTLAIKVDGCTGKGKFTADIDSLSRIISNRAMMQMYLKNGKVEFSSGRYTGMLVLLPYEEIQFEKKEEKDCIKISRNTGFANSINKARRHLALSNISNRGQPLILNIKVEKGKMICIVNDSFHFASFECKVTTDKDFMFNIHDETLRKILSLTKNEEEYDLVIEKSCVKVKAENIEATMTMMQVDMKSMDLVIDIIKEKRQSNIVVTNTASDGIVAVVENMMAIFESNETIQLSLDKNLKISYKTSYGNICEEIQCKIDGKKAKIKISPELLEDTISNIPQDEKIRIGIIKDKGKCLLLESDQGFCYVISSNS